MTERARLNKRNLDAWLAITSLKDRILWDENLKGFGVRQKPSGIASFILQYRNKFRQSRRLTLGRVGTLTVQQARDLAVENLANVRHDGDPASERKSNRVAKTINDLCDLYVDACQDRIKDKEMKASTLAMDLSRIKTHVRPLIGNKPIASLTESDIRKFVADVRDGKTAKSHSSGRGGVATGGAGVASRTLGMLKTMLELARRERLLVKNPALKVRKIKSNKKKRPLSCQEIAQLGAIMNLPVPPATAIGIAAIKFALLSGFRRMEALSMQRSFIDSDNGCIWLPETKSGPQTRPVGKAALQVLNQLPWDGEYVFPARSGPGHFKGAPKVLANLCAAAGIERHVTMHILRHTFATSAATLKFGEFTISGLLGHSSGSITKGYVDIPDTVLCAAADVVSAKIATALDGQRQPKSSVNDAIKQLGNTHD